MKERPALFTKENRKGVRSGDKTHTRRVITVPWVKGKRVLPYEPYYVEEDGKLLFMDEYGDYHPMEQVAPWQVGDHLWLKEAYQITTCWRGHTVCGNYPDNGGIFKRELSGNEWKRWSDRKKPHAKTSSLFMYKSLARTWLKVTRVWIERVQDISPDDILAEGLGSYCWDYAESSDGTGDMFMYADHTVESPSWCPNNMSSCECIEDVFSWLWDSINKKRGFGWNVNPWVFCYEFEEIK